MGWVISGHVQSSVRFGYGSGYFGCSGQNRLFSFRMSVRVWIQVVCFGFQVCSARSTSEHLVPILFLLKQMNCIRSALIFNIINAIVIPLHIEFVCLSSFAFHVWYVMWKTESLYIWQIEGVKLDNHGELEVMTRKI